MAIMDEEIGLESGGGEVIDATSAISDIAKNKAVGGLAESGEDIGEDEGVHEKTFGELKGNAGGAGGEDSPYALVNLEVVVGRKERDGGVQGRILEDGIGNLILHKSLRRRPRSWRGFVSSALIENSELWWLLDLRPGVHTRLSLSIPFPLRHRLLRRRRGSSGGRTTRRRNPVQICNSTHLRRLITYATTYPGDSRICNDLTLGSLDLLQTLLDGPICDGKSFRRRSRLTVTISVRSFSFIFDSARFKSAATSSGTRTIRN